MLNEEYPALGEHYSVAIMPAGVRKPKHKASVEGTVGMIASAVIARLRNETFTSLPSLNAGIRRALDDFNGRKFQKRQGSRSSVFEIEEKPCLKALPLHPYEVCEWSYNHKVGPNSHIWRRNGQYSVPCRFIDRKVDVKFNEYTVHIYFNRTEIAMHQILPGHLKNAMRTDESHLPMCMKQESTPENALDRARAIGPGTFEVLRRMFDEAKVREQPLQAALSILALGTSFSPRMLEQACELQLARHHLPLYGMILDQMRKLKERKDYEDFKEGNRNTGLVRGAGYYRKECR